MSHPSPPLRILFWNIWAARFCDQLLDHLRQSPFDIGCFTEVTDCTSQFPGMTSVCYDSEDPTHPPSRVDAHYRLRSFLSLTHELQYDTADRSDWTCVRTERKFNFVGFGSLLAHRHELEVVGGGSELIDLSQYGTRQRVLQFVVISHGGKRYLVAHLHGVWLKGNTKGDAPPRYQQTQQVVDLLKNFRDIYRADEVIFGGDLNLDITTRALLQLEIGFPFRNLIREFGITNTRTPLYRSFHNPDHPNYADYVLVTKGVQVESLTVGTDVQASDHAPLILSIR